MNNRNTACFRLHFHKFGYITQQIALLLACPLFTAFGHAGARCNRVDG
ncbi:Uncharacterised protein [Vibrio cholerae]|nr:Uncharacterised protein [Vibrio cholerae]